MILFLGLSSNVYTIDFIFLNRKNVARFCDIFLYIILNVHSEAAQLLHKRHFQ